MIRAALFALAVFFAAALPANATVNTASSSVSVIGNGAQTQFTFSFIGISPAYITVIYTDTSGNQTVLTQGTGPSQYQITLAAPVQGATWGVGGTVVYAPGSNPIPVGSTLTIARTVPLLQAISLQNQASYGAIGKGAEKASDLIEMQLQQVSAAQSRSILANIANTSLPAPLPPAAQVANLGLCFDATGNNVVACAQVPSASVSSVMGPVINAPTLLAARTALGLGTLGTEGIGAGLEDDGAGNLRTALEIQIDSANTTVTSSFHRTSRISNGPITYTLPEAGTLWNGFGFWITAVGGSITVALPSNDTFLGSSSGVSQTVLQGATAYISTNGAVNGTWLISFMSSGTSAGTHFPGEIIKLRSQTCPVGTLPENGAAVSRATYANLFTAIGTAWGSGDGLTTFNVPNAGGQFDRGWEVGQTVDPSRVFGSSQADTVGPHTHGVTALPGVSAGANNAGNGCCGVGGQSGTTQTTNVQTPTATTETRPKNLTALSCIVTGNYR